MHYQQAFLKRDLADKLFSWCLNSGEIAWREETFSIYGREVLAPRRLAWFGASGVNYRYTGMDHLAKSWPSKLRELSQKIEQEFGVSSNFVLLNRYDTGSDYMGWHRDNERGVGQKIASLSLGETRRFRYRCTASNSGHGPSKALDLDHGSLLVFDGRQPHTLTKTRQNKQTRINLTFRYVDHA